MAEYKRVVSESVVFHGTGSQGMIVSVDQTRLHFRGEIALTQSEVYELIRRLEAWMATGSLELEAATEKKGGRRSLT